MSEVKHTQTPWRVEEGTVLIWGAYDPNDSSTFGMGYPVTECRTQLGHGSPLARSFKEEEAEANAAFIVRAVNSHEQMLAAANDALSGWRYIREQHGDLYGVGWDRVEQALVAAIAAAGDA
jgi:hypothetical protein